MAGRHPRDMHRLRFVLLTGLFAACGASPDDRPATLEVISLAVLAPACGTVACHSSTTNAKGYAFDTLDGARASLRLLVRAGEPAQSRLIDVITSRQMPPDAPMADQDVALIEQWIASGAEGL